MKFRALVPLTSALALSLSLGAVASGAPPSGGGPASITAWLPAAGDRIRATRARESILEMELAAAKSILDGAGPEDQTCSIERARHDIHAGDYDAAKHFSDLNTPTQTRSPLP